MNQIKSKFFDFKKLVDNLDVKVLLDDNYTFLCFCTGALFVDKDHLHIIMGNLKGFYSHNLQKLFYRSPNYRKTELADYQKAIKNIITGIKSCIQS